MHLSWLKPRDTPHTHRSTSPRHTSSTPHTGPSHSGNRRAAPGSGPGKASVTPRDHDERQAGTLPARFFFFSPNGARTSWRTNEILLMMHRLTRVSPERGDRSQKLPLHVIVIVVQLSSTSALQLRWYYRTNYKALCYINYMIRKVSFHGHFIR